MAMTTAAEIEAVLARHQAGIKAALRQVIGDVEALTRAGRVAVDCAARVKGTADAMTAARAALVACWAAPSSAAFQAGSEPLPGGLAATERLFAALSTGLPQVAQALSQAQRHLATIDRDFGSFASQVSPPYPAVHPAGFVQMVDQAGATYANAAAAAARRLDGALEQFSAALAPLVRELAAVPPVTP